MMRKSGWIAIGATLFMCAGVSEAHAVDGLRPGVDQQTWTFHVNNKKVSSSATAAAAADISCKVKLNSPHYSKKGKSVIAKARVHCSGSPAGTPVHVSFKEHFSSVSGGTCKPNKVNPGPGVPRWSGSTPAQTVLTDGKTVTYYLPPVGSSKLNFTASWYVTATPYAEGSSLGSKTASRYTGPSCP